MMNPYNTKKHTFWISRMLILTLLFPIHVSCKAESNDNDTNNCNYIRDGFGANGDTEISTQTVVDGLEVPWGLAFLPNGDLLVTERPGRVRLVKDYSGNAQLVDNPVAKIGRAHV